MEKSEWVFMPHPGHLIVSQDCKFFLNTYVGNYIVSTVGEYFPDASVREIFAESRGIKLKGMGDARKYDYMQKLGYEEIGHNRIYETMVFKAEKSKDKCCPYKAIYSEQVDFDGYNEAEDAFKGHMKLCRKWSK